jgi:hypothetical protein
MAIRCTVFAFKVAASSITPLDETLRPVADDEAIGFAVCIGDVFAKGAATTTAAGNEYCCTPVADIELIPSLPADLPVAHGTSAATGLREYKPLCRGIGIDASEVEELAIQDRDA